MNHTETFMEYMAYKRYMYTKRLFKIYSYGEWIGAVLSGGKA